MSAQEPRSKSVGDRLAWLGGGDQDLLVDVPTARDRFVQMGLVLLTTASLAVVSMTFALTNALDVPLVPAAAAGLLWGFVILNLDRFLVVTMGSTRSLRRLALLAAPRLAMAVVLALVISTPLVLQVFRSDIRVQMNEAQLERSQQDREREKASKEQGRLDEVVAEIGRLEAILGGRLPTAVTSPPLETAETEYTEARGALAARRKARDAAYEAWQCELYGAGAKCRKASRRSGSGPLAAAKRRQYLAAQGRFETAETRLEEARRAREAEESKVREAQGASLEKAQDDARAKLPDLEAERDDLEAFIDARATGDSEDNAADDGLLAQLSALLRAGEKDGTLHLAHLLVAALFFLIEILPVTGKILLNAGPPSAYDMAAQLRDEEVRDRVRIHRTEARHIEEGKSRTRVGLEAHMRVKEKEIGEQANDHVAGEMTKIVELALQEWSERVARQLGTHPAPTASSNGNGGRRRTVPRFRKLSSASADGYRMPDGDEI